jgi:citrate synthase
MTASGYLSATEVTEELGISFSTLYSYVSRGLLRSESADKSKRTRRYYAEDVQRLKERQEMRRNPQEVVDTALRWGAPILDSALTLIDGGRFYYRGKDVLDLAARWTVEEVAAWVWLHDEKQAEFLFPQQTVSLSSHAESLLARLSGASSLVRFQALLPVLGADDLAAYDLRPAQAALTGARILRYLALLATNQSDTFTGEGIAATLQRVWLPGQPQAVRLLNAALVLCADHELNVSSFTARCVASAGVAPYAVVSAGLAALQGVKHGGMSSRVEALFRETGTPDQARATIVQRVQRGESVPGFGHPLYPGGDPRGQLLLDWVKAAYPQSPGLRLAMAVAEAAQSALSDRPNVDFGLAALCAALELPSGAAITLFAIGRTIGWIGHAMEEYQANRLIRPRAHYTGILPE